MKVSTAVALGVAKLPGVPSAHPYNLTVGPGFVWFRVAKVGTRSILRLLDGAGLPISDHDGLERRKYALGFYRRHYKFAFVRNPWDRLASCWQNQVIKAGRFTGADTLDLTDFGAFVGWVATHELATCDAHFRHQSALIDLTSLDHLGRFETFTSDLLLIMARLGIDGTIPHANASGTRDYRDMYTARTRDIVGDLYAGDIATFGYSFDGPV